MLRIIYHVYVSAPLAGLLMTAEGYEHNPSSTPKFIQCCFPVCSMYNRNHVCKICMALASRRTETCTNNIFCLSRYPIGRIHLLLPLSWLHPTVGGENITGPAWMAGSIWTEDANGGTNGNERFHPAYLQVRLALDTSRIPCLQAVTTPYYKYANM